MLVHDIEGLSCTFQLPVWSESSVSMIEQVLMHDISICLCL